jgi:hypothetical protein
VGRRCRRLDSNALVSSIPTELGQATALTSLFLSSNTLTGTIPSELGRLTLLTTLFLQTNQMQGSLPTELAALTAVTSLYVPPQVGHTQRGGLNTRGFVGGGPHFAAPAPAPAPATCVSQAVG